MTRPCNTSIEEALIKFIQCNFFFFVFLCSAFTSAQTEVDNATSNKFDLNEKILVVKQFYGKELVGLLAIQQIFPEEWLLPEYNFGEDKARIELAISELKKDDDSSLLNADQKKEIADNLTFLELQLRWFYFTDAERKNLIAEAKAKQLVKANKEEANKSIEKAAQIAELGTLKKLEPTLSVDERAVRLYNISLDIDKSFQWISLQTRLLGEAQIKFGQNARDWLDISGEINNALEDESFVPGAKDFSSYRQLLRDRLAASNSLVKTQSAFLRKYFGPDYEERSSIDMQSVQIRDTDNEETRNRIHEIQQKRVELQTELDTLHRSQYEFIQQLIDWQGDYRQSLLEIRGQLITEVIEKSAYVIYSADPVVVEIDSIISSVLFYAWKQEFESDNIYANKQHFAFSALAHLFKLAMLFFFIVWLLVRKKKILSVVTRWGLSKASSLKWKRFIQGFMTLVRHLYFFIVLFLLGNLTINFLVSVGISNARFLAPLLNHVVLFLLFFGTLNFISPLLSQRQRQTQSTEEEIAAIERVFEFVPTLYIYYWLVSGVITIILFQFLQQSLLQFYTAKAFFLLFSFSLFIIVWLQRKSWRLINEKATHSVWWQSITEKSFSKFWEPIILLIGGGIGVYRVVWKILANRLNELEVTRSFHAMVSRALLERQYRESVKKLNPAWFPENYWRAFNFLIPAEPEWYVSREEAEESLLNCYAEWKGQDKAARILVCGDRGIGKTELITNFLRKQNIPYLHSNLRIGDTSIERVCERLSEELLGVVMLNEEELFAVIRKLPPQVIRIENIENCLLRRVGGFDALTLIIDLILHTSDLHFWIVTCTSHAWTVSRRALIGANSFTETVYVKGMSEEQIKNMLLNRHNRSSAVRPDFSHLNLGEDENTKDKGMELYFRILWDYTKGNPRQALYYWKASLSWDGEKTTVRLFDVPEQRVLENLPDTTLMLLAALIEHNGLDIESLAGVMHTSINTIRRRIEELAPYGIVFYIENQEKIGWHVESFWTRAVENYLEKRQFLYRGEAI